MTKLYKYQKRDVKRILRFKGRTLLALEMGLGKTVIALTFLRIRPALRPALVVCPASAKWVWKAEIRKHTKLTCRILNGKTPKHYRRLPDVTIINYDILSAWKNHLKDMGFQVLIIDECHYGKNWKARRTKALASLGKCSEHILALSGTPLTNRPKELFTTLKLLVPWKFNSFVPYAFRYCNRRMTPWGWDDTGASHLDELHDILLQTCMIRHTKSEVLKELPPKRRTVVPLPIQKPAEYAEAEDDFIKWLAKRDVKKAKRAENAEQLVKLGYLKRLAAELKMKAVIEWVDNFFEETDEKLVLFAFHKKVIERLKAEYPKTSVVIDGSTSQKDREKNVLSLGKDKKTRLFIGQIVAAGTAITLTSASTVAFVELDWVPGNHIQAEDRCHRIGQKNHVQVYYLIAKNTIEQDLCKVIQKKSKIITSVLDGASKNNDMNVFDQLMKTFEKRIK
jgi:SWI/SNF-related matrix-associated actin-dependent regulator 1 of chromatin subfamily A